MKLFKAALIATIFTGFATTAQAQDSGTYVNFGVKTYEFDTYNLMARLGYNFTENLGIEVEGSVGIIGKEEAGFDVDSKWDLGAYVIGYIPLSEQVELFGRVGYTTVNFDVNGVADQDFDGFAAGGGLQYNFDSTNALRLGYTYNDADDLGADVIDLSYVRKF